VTAPWTICDGCFEPVDIIAGEGREGRETIVHHSGAWSLRCPTCGTFNSGDHLPIADELRARHDAMSAPILARLGDA